MGRKFDAEEIEKYFKQNKEKLDREFGKWVARQERSKKIVGSPEYKEWLKNYISSHERADNDADCFYEVAPEDCENLRLLGYFNEYIRELNETTDFYDYSEDVCELDFRFEEPINYFSIDNQLYSMQTVS